MDVKQVLCVGLALAAIGLAGCDDGGLRPPTKGNAGTGDGGSGPQDAKAKDETAPQDGDAGTAPTTKAGPKAAAIAVVDLDAVAQRSGLAELINKRINAAQQQANQQLQETRERLQENILKLEKEFGDKPTDEQRAQLNRTRLLAAQQLQEKGRELNNALRQLRTALMRNYRQQIAPVANAVARERGFTIVVVRNADLLTWDKQHDITNAVLGRIELRTIPKPKLDDGDGSDAETGDAGTGSSDDDD